MSEAGVVETQGIDARALYRRITWRLIPYLFVLYIVAYIDRVNVGFAAMDMKRALHYSDTVYGTGAGMFFLGYALLDLPLESYAAAECALCKAGVPLSDPGSRRAS